MKTVITGALGHIGSRLIRELPSAFPGGEIIMLDNLSTQRYCSLFDLPRESNYRFIEADILDYDLTPLFRGADVVIHLAGITNAEGSFAIRDQVEEVNFKGTERVARACVEARCAMIFPSTTSVYGTQAALVDENCPITELKPQSPYAESKLKAEDLLCQLGKEAGLRYVICRFGTIFGASPGMRFHTAINKFCWQAVMGQPITIWSTAFDQQRPYLDLIDASQAIAFIIENDLFDGHIYNISTLNSTVRHVIDTIREFVPKVELAFIDNQVMNNW